MADQTQAEELRLATLAAYRIVGSTPDPRFDAILQHLVESFGAAFAKIAFLDADTAWIKATNSTVYNAIPRTQSFAAKYVIEPVRTVIIPDLLLADPLVTTMISGTVDLPVAAVAGVPIQAPNGAAIGALIVYDTKPRDFSMTQVEALTRAARKIVEHLESTRAALELAGEQLAIPGHAVATVDELSDSSLTDVSSLGGLVDNSRSIVEEFVVDNLSRAGWWAAQVWWAEDEYLYPEPWTLDPVAPEVLGRLRSRSGAVPVPFKGVEFATPTLIDLDSAPWLGSVSNIAQSGVRHLLVLDVAGAVSVALRLVFVVPEGIRVQPAVISALETGARLLPRVLRQEQARGELLYRSTHDTLTGLLNRRGLDQVVAPLAGTRTSQTHAIMYLDLDHFKQVNDNHGHAVGDQLLKYVAAQILKQVRPTDSVVRLGGDEFVVLAKNIGSAAAAYSLGKRVLNAVNSTFVSDSGLQLPVSTSIGVAIWDSEDAFDDAMRVADALMYQAKQAGGALAVEELAGSTPQDSITHVALNQVDLTLVSAVAQPLRSAKDGSIVGLLVNVDSPLRSIGPRHLADAILDCIAKSQIHSLELVLLRVSNHFWNHAQLVPDLFDLLIAERSDVIFSALIDTGLIGAEPSECMLALAEDPRVGLVLEGNGASSTTFNLLDVLMPVGLTVQGDRLGMLFNHGQPRRSLRALVAVAAALQMDFYCLDWQGEPDYEMFSAAGLGFVSFKSDSSEKKG
jgi:diguanylate cyclase (GGDEF)-like protein